MKDEYKKDHRDAKTIVCSIVILFLTVSNYLAFPFSLILEILAVVIWFFGVNPTAYLIESIRHHAHKHDKI